MFGYIKPYVPELKTKEYELYSAIYCGLCRSMKANTGAASALTLSYDYVFLAALRAAVAKENLSVKLKRCPFHPLKKKQIADDSQSLTYTAYVSALMTYFKLRDDISDEHGLKKLRADVLLPFAKAAKKHIPAALKLEDVLSPFFESLSALEKEKSPSIDETAKQFGYILGTVCSYGFDGAEQRILYEFGFHIGKYLYIIDAADDIADDCDKGRYNPILTAYGTSAFEEREVPMANGKTKKKRLTERVIGESLMTAALLELKAADSALDLLDFSESRDVEAIIKNIVYLGLPKEFDRVLNGLSDMQKHPQTVLREHNSNK